MATTIILILIVVLVVGFLKKPLPPPKKSSQLYDWAEREGYDNEFAHQYIDHLDELMQKQFKEKQEDDKLAKRNAEIRDDVQSNKPLELNINDKTYNCKYFPFRDCYTPLFEDRISTNYILLNKFRDVPRCLIYNELQNEFKKKDIDY